MSSEQVEYICPQCRRRTVVNAKSGEEDSVFCPRCEIDMKPYIKTSDLAAAAANAPSSSGGAATKAKAKTTRTRKTAEGAPAKAAKAPKATKATKGSRTTIQAETSLTPTQPDFGEFRCQCCGFTKTITMGTEKPAGGWRCPSCFVKLTWLKS